MFRYEGVIFSEQDCMSSEGAGTYSREAPRSIIVNLKQMCLFSILDSPSTIVNNLGMLNLCKDP